MSYSLESNILKALESLKNEVTPEDKLLASNLLLQYSNLVSRQMSGEDVLEKLRIIKAAMYNIEAGVGSNLATRANTLFLNFLLAVFDKLI